MKNVNRNNEQDLPYRLGVGMMIVNKNNKVFVGKRIDARVRAWQMPQGGIDLGETPSSAAMREMLEEVGSNKGYIIAESKCWYSYDLPKFLIPRLWNGTFRGQKQRWFLIRFTGDDHDININNSQNAEFNDWHWARVEELPDIIIPFKRKLYRAVVGEFSALLATTNLEG